jgi:hypothetical protein
MKTTFYLILALLLVTACTKTNTAPVATLPPVTTPVKVKPFVVTIVPPYSDQLTFHSYFMLKGDILTDAQGDNGPLGTNDTWCQSNNNYPYLWDMFITSTKLVSTADVRDSSAKLVLFNISGTLSVTLKYGYTNPDGTDTVILKQHLIKFPGQQDVFTEDGWATQNGIIRLNRYP